MPKFKIVLKVYSPTTVRDVTTNLYAADKKDAEKKVRELYEFCRIKKVELVDG